MFCQALVLPEKGPGGASVIGNTSNGVASPTSSLLRATRLRTCGTHLPSARPIPLSLV